MSVKQCFRFAVALSFAPIAVAIMIAFALLTVAGFILLTPYAWAIGASLNHFWDQTTIEFWSGDWMDPPP